MSDVENVISQLEKQRAAIDRALSALREVAGPRGTGSGARATNQSKPRKNRLSPEGRRRIIEATKKRWAAKKASGARANSNPTSAPRRSRRGKLTAQGRQRLALAMKKRWAAAKKAGKTQLG